MIEKFRIQTGYGDTYWPIWLSAVLFYVGWDTVSTYYGMEVWHMTESVEFSSYLINEYGFVAFALVKLFVLVVMYLTIHLIPDKVWTLNYTIPINQELLKDVYIPMVIVLLGVYATINNFLLVW